MATLDHVILRVNDLDASVAFYTRVMGFSAEGMDGPFAVLRVSPEFQDICSRLKADGIAHGPTFDTVGVNTQPGEETGARGRAPTLYFNDPNKHLLEIRTYEH